MAKEIIKAKDKIIKRYSKTGLEQVNLDKKEIKSITSKIQDVELNTNKVFSQTNSNYEIGKSRKYNYSIQEQKITQQATSGLTSQATTQDVVQHSQTYSEQSNTNIGTRINNSYENNQNVVYNDMPYNKENLKNTYDGQFRQTNQVLSHSTSSNNNTISSTTVNTKKSISRIDSSSSRLLEEKTTERLKQKNKSSRLKYSVKDIKLSYDAKNGSLKFEMKGNRLSREIIDIKENNTKNRISALKFSNKDFKSSVKDRLYSAYDKAMDNNDETDTSNEIFTSISKLHRGKKKLVYTSKFIVSETKNILDKKVIKKEKKKIQQRLKFDDEVKREFNPIEKTKLREKSLLTSTTALGVQFTKNKVVSSYANAFETNDKTDVTNTLLKDIRFTKGIYSDVRIGFKTRQTKKELKESRQLLKKRQNRLKSKSLLGKEKIKNQKLLQKKALKKKYSRYFRNKTQRTIRDKAAQMVVKSTKKTAVLVQKALAKIVASIVGALGVPVASICAVVLIAIVLFTSIFASFSQVMAYTYPAKDKEITKTNDFFEKRELSIKSKAYNPPSGYDDYTFDIGYIGHNKDDLIAYLSVKYYKEEFTKDNVQSELESILSEAYKDESWVEAIEHTSTGTDESGNEYTSYWYTYTYHSILKTKDVTEILKSRLSADELKDFERFRETKGMFSMFKQPLKADYKSLVTKKFGYQFSLNSTSDIEYIDYMELMANSGEEVYAMIPGKINNKSDYIEIKTPGENSVRYYGISLTSSGKIKAGDTLGRVSGDRLKIQVVDKDGNLLDPYFYIESKIDGEPGVITDIGSSNINLGNIKPSGYGKDAVEYAKQFVGQNGSYMFKNLITPTTGHHTEEWCADFCASVITNSIGGTIKGNTIYDADGKPFMNWSAGVAQWADYARASGMLHPINSGYQPKAGDLILSYGNHIEMIADPSNFTTISGNSGHNNDNLSKVKVKTAGSATGWTKFSPRWTAGNTYIISVPYKAESKEAEKQEKNNG